jgi:hypothetical protein
MSMDYAPHIERIVSEAGTPLSTSEIVARLIQATGELPSFDDLEDAFARTGREPLTVQAYAAAVTDFIPVMERGMKAATESMLPRTLPGAILRTAPLGVLVLTAFAVKAYWIGVLLIAFGALFVHCILHPDSRLSALMPWTIGVRQRADESSARYQLRSGFLVVLLGALCLFGGIWGRSALYDSGVARGDRPLLEIILMIPMPLLGVTLLLWGLGRSIKGLAGVAAGEKEH